MMIEEVERQHMQGKEEPGSTSHRIFLFKHLRLHTIASSTVVEGKGRRRKERKTGTELKDLVQWSL